MRNLFIIIGLLIFSTPLYSEKNKDKEHTKLIERYDVPLSVRQFTGAENRKQFWSDLVIDNPRLQKLNKDISKNKKLEKTALKNVAAISIFNAENDPRVVHEVDSVMGTILDRIGLSPDVCRIYLYDDDRVGASTALDNDGKFSILLNRGLVTAVNGDYDMLTAAIVHQIAHGLLSHHLTTEYAIAKKIKKNEMWAGAAIGFGGGFGLIGGALIGGAAGALIKAPKEGLHQSLEDMSNHDIFILYRYDKRCETEADLVAYRFMDQIEGKGDKYIQLLDIIRKTQIFENTLPYSPNEIYDRILLLEFATAHPEITYIPKKKKSNDR